MILSLDDVAKVLSLLSLDRLKNLQIRLEKPGLIFVNDRILMQKIYHLLYDNTSGVPSSLTKKDFADIIDDLIKSIDNHPLIQNLDAFPQEDVRRAVGFNALASSNTLNTEFEDVLCAAGMFYCTIEKNRINVTGTRSKENFFSILLSRYDDGKKFWPHKEDLSTFIEYELGDLIHRKSKR